MRLHYADGTVEDHRLQNGIHFADYIRVVDVPRSKLAFTLGTQQIRYLSIEPKRKDQIDRIELVKGPDRSAPVVMAVTVEAAGTQSIMVVPAMAGIGCPGRSGNFPGVTAMRLTKARPSRRC